MHFVSFAGKKLVSVSSLIPCLYCGNIWVNFLHLSISPYTKLTYISSFECPVTVRNLGHFKIRVLVSRPGRHKCLKCIKYTFDYSRSNVIIYLNSKSAFNLKLVNVGFQRQFRRVSCTFSLIFICIGHGEEL